MKLISTLAILLILINYGLSQSPGTDLTDADWKSSKFNHDYSQTLVMKLFLSKPDLQGGSVVSNTFEDAMEIIRTTDKLTLGVPKIIYLVGWQYNGHDDKYPAFFEINSALKRPQDRNARESLLWLIYEARKYNTAISFHINMTDAYDESPLWDTYVKNDLISKTTNGNLMVIGNYNDRKAYQINYQNEWKRGFAQRRIDSLIQLVPSLKEAGTIHIDAWIARESRGHYESAITEAKFQQKILKYWNDQGIDVTSEWAMDYMVGKIPYAWHFNHFTQEDYLNVPANVYTGSGLNRDLKYTDFGLGFLFGKSMYGENVFPQLQNKPDDKTWEQRFINEFYQNCLQYFFLNKLERIKVEGAGNNRTAFFSDNVQVSLTDSTVTHHNNLLRKKNFISFPIVWKQEKCLAIYSKSRVEKTIQIPAGWGNVKSVILSEISASGENELKNITVKMSSFIMQLESGKPYLVRPKTK